MLDAMRKACLKAQFDEFFLFLSGWAFKLTLHDAIRNASSILAP